MSVANDTNNEFENSNLSKKNNEKFFNRKVYFHFGMFITLILLILIIVFVVITFSVNGKNKESSKYYKFDYDNSFQYVYNGTGGTDAQTLSAFYFEAKYNFSMGFNNFKGEFGVTTPPSTSGDYPGIDFEYSLTEKNIPWLSNPNQSPGYLTADLTDDITEGNNIVNAFLSINGGDQHVQFAITSFIIKIPEPWLARNYSNYVLFYFGISPSEVINITSSGLNDFTNSKFTLEYSL